MAFVDARRLARQAPDAAFCLAIGIDEILLHDEPVRSLAAADDVDREFPPQAAEPILEYPPGPAAPVEIGVEVERGLPIREILDAHLLTPGKGWSGKGDGSQRERRRGCLRHAASSSARPFRITAESAAWRASSSGKRHISATATSFSATGTQA